MSPIMSTGTGIYRYGFHNFWRSSTDSTTVGAATRLEGVEVLELSGLFLLFPVLLAAHPTVSRRPLLLLTLLLRLTSLYFIINTYYSVFELCSTK